MDFVSNKNILKSDLQVCMFAYWYDANEGTKAWQILTSINAWFHIRETKKADQ